jgi:hypothetical protein
VQKAQESGLMPKNACVYDDVHIEDTVHLHCSVHNNWNTVDSENDILFDETFAKAFWGDSFADHLAQLGTADHPLKYIEKFLERVW